MAAYSFCDLLEMDLYWRNRETYGSILGLLSITALECDAVALVLQTLGSNQTLDLRGLGVRLLALTLWLHLTTDNELADLKLTALRQQNVLISHSARPHGKGKGRQ